MPEGGGALSARAGRVVALVGAAPPVMASALLLAVVLTYVRSMARAARSVAPLG